MKNKNTHFLIFKTAFINFIRFKKVYIPFIILFSFFLLFSLLAIFVQIEGVQTIYQLFSYAFLLISVSVVNIQFLILMFEDSWSNSLFDLEIRKGVKKSNIIFERLLLNFVISTMIILSGIFIYYLISFGTPNSLSIYQTKFLIGLFSIFLIDFIIKGITVAFISFKIKKMALSFASVFLSIVVLNPALSVTSSFINPVILNSDTDKLPSYGYNFPSNESSFQEVFVGQEYAKIINQYSNGILNSLNKVFSDKDTDTNKKNFFDIISSSGFVYDYDLLQAKDINGNILSNWLKNDSTSSSETASNSKKILEWFSAVHIDVSGNVNLNDYKYTWLSDRTPKNIQIKKANNLITEQANKIRNNLKINENQKEWDMIFKLIKPYITTKLIPLSISFHQGKSTEYAFRSILNSSNAVYRDMIFTNGFGDDFSKLSTNFAESAIFTGMLTLLNGYWEYQFVNSNAETIKAWINSYNKQISKKLNNPFILLQDLSVGIAVADISTNIFNQDYSFTLVGGIISTNKIILINNKIEILNKPIYNVWLAYLMPLLIGLSMVLCGSFIIDKKLIR